MIDRTADVKEFHRAMGVTDTLDVPGVPEDETVRLRLRLIAEEFFELLDACSTSPRESVRSQARLAVSEWIESGFIDVDLPAFADATIDLDYVVEGSRIAFGIDGEPLWRAVHAANMRKTGGGKRADGKILKGKDWVPPPIAELLEQQRRGTPSRDLSHHETGTVVPTIDGLTVKHG